MQEYTSRITSNRRALRPNLKNFISKGMHSDLGRLHIGKLDFQTGWSDSLMPDAYMWQRAHFASSVTQTIFQCVHIQTSGPIPELAILLTTRFSSCRPIPR